MRTSYKSTHRGRRRNFGGKRSFKAKKVAYHKFINKNPKNVIPSEYIPKNTFSDFVFDKQILENLNRKRYVNPTHIQDESIPHILKGKDIIGLANTGSGKTAAFILPIIQKVLLTKDNVLIITPTRELAEQIQNEFIQFSNRMSMYSVLCVGGLNINLQIRALRRNPNVIIGTPGRIKDLMNRNSLELKNTKTLVLDEFDSMLDMGFLPDVKNILSNLPEKRQSLCFSATISDDIERILQSIVVNPVRISVRTSETGEHIAQDVIKARTKEAKLKELVNMLEQDHFEKVLVFGQMKYSVQRLSNTLSKMGFKSVAIHGNKSQPQRQRALKEFKEGKANILVATDVAARGLDIPNVSHVINFDQPQTHQEYVHRIGRTGRAGKPGQAYTFV
ncbi:MAG: DEAD/DEAH box helicase [Candidatus Pacebacteria bacterium]|nr:DEAD/DEAH box helicase [Candidatus Paceibacterota bacterium]